MNLTPEQREKLKGAAEALEGGANCSNNDYAVLQDDFEEAATPVVILALLAQLADREDSYNQAVESVAQLQDDVFAVKAELEAEKRKNAERALQYLSDEGQARGDCDA